MYRSDDIINERYTVTSSLGVGFASRVYLAVDRFINRKVVLKEFETGARAPSPARIQREVDVYSRLSHTNILQLYDLFFFNDNVFLVFPYIEGCTLSDRVKKGPLLLKNVIQYSLGIAQALYYLHQQNIIHRDIKPSNIFISRNKPILLDFGIAKTDTSNADTTLTITSTGQIIGTPIYIAPEAISGKTVSTQSDIYSFGTVIYELLAGKLPFRASNIVELAQKICNDLPPSLDTYHDSIPEDLMSVVMRMLSKKPEERPNISEIIKTFEDILRRESHEKYNQTLKREKSIENLSVEEFIKTVIIENESIKDHVIDKKEAEATGFFANELERQKEHSKSREFYRMHLDKDYCTLLSQAKLSFWLWVLFSATGFIVLVIGIILLFQGKIVEGSISLTSEVLIFFIQKIFKIREDDFRDKASKKNKHLEIGNIWNLAVQSIDGMMNNEEKKEKLSKLIDALIKQVENDK